MGGASKMMKYVGPALETVGGAAATATGNPEMGVPMMVSGISSGVGSGVGGSAGQGIAGVGALGSVLGGAMGGGPNAGSTADAAATAGRMPSSDVMRSAMGAPGAGGDSSGMSGAAPLLQKYGPLLAKAGLAMPGQAGAPSPATPTAAPPMTGMGARPQTPAPSAAPAAQGAPASASPMAAFQAYRSFLQNQVG